MNIQTVELPSQFNVPQKQDINDKVVELPQIEENTQDTIKEEFNSELELKEDKPEPQPQPEPPCRSKIFGELKKKPTSVAYNNNPEPKKNSSLSYGIPILMGVLLLSKLL